MIKKFRAGLVTALLLAVTIRVLWWSITPLIPYLVVGLVLITITGFMYYRTRRW